MRTSTQHQPSAVHVLSISYRYVQLPSPIHDLTTIMICRFKPPGELMLDRRAFLAVCSRLGLTTTLLPGALWAMADEKSKVTRDMIDHAAFIADVPIADEYKD